MKVVVIYESMFGNTHLIADAIGAGAAATGDVVVVPVARADAEVLRGADLIVVGGPTHVHGLSRASTRASAAEMADEPDSDLELDADAGGPGLREWFESVGRLETKAAAFDTRVKGPTLVTGQASKGIAKRLVRMGCELIAEPESFLVTKETHLLDAEEAHARRFGAELAAALG
jgi:hypothetical protein